MAIKNGQHFAYEVHRLVESGGDSTYPAKFEPVATLWDKEQAQQLERVVNGRPVDPYDGPSIKRIGVIVVGNDAYYDTAKPPVPVDLVASTVTDAMALMFGSEKA